MKIKDQNTALELARLSSAVLKDPESWEGWTCLAVRVRPALHHKLAPEDFEPVRDFLCSFLAKIEGTSYFFNNAVYVVCRDLPPDLVEDIAGNLCEIAYGHEPLFWAHDFYELSKDPERFVDEVQRRRHISDGEIAQQAHPFWHPEKIGHPENASAPVVQDHSKVFILERAEEDGDDKADSLIQKSFKKVLLIDDDPVILWMVRHALKHECELVCASSAEEGFRTYRNFKPDVVLLDINMPDKSGHEVLQGLMTEDPRACVIMLSGHNGMDNLVNALQKGACAFIPKPFSKDKLLDVIRKHSA